MSDLKEDFKRRFAGTGSIDAAWDYVFTERDSRIRNLCLGLSNLYAELANLVEIGNVSVDPKHVLAKVESLVELADWERERT